MPALETIKLRRGTAAQWTSANPILAAGEPGWETDTGNLKIGDGSTAWSSLSYQAGKGAFVPNTALGKHLVARPNWLFGDTLVGAAVVPTPSLVDAHTDNWHYFYSDIVAGGTSIWPGQLAWVEQQIDALVSSATKGNAVRLMGCVGGIQNGFYTRAQYIAAMNQILAYCQQKGLVVYCTLGSAWFDFGAGSDTNAFPTTAQIDDMVAVAQAMQESGCVVAIDIVQEYLNNLPAGKVAADATAEIQTIYNAIKAGGVDLPCTASFTIQTSGSWGQAQIATMAGFADFIDCHVWYDLNNPATTPAVPDMIAMLKVLPAWMPLIIGEFGAYASMTGAQRTATYNAVVSLVSGGRVSGVFSWAVGDQSVSTQNQQFGMYSGSPGGTLTARTDVTASYLTLPRHPQPTAMRKYVSGDLAVAATTVVNINFDTLSYDYGCLSTNNGSGSNQFYVPPGMGGLYKITLVAFITAGASAGTADFTIINGSSTTIWEFQAQFSASQTGMVQGSDIVNLADGTVGVPRVYASTAITLTHGATRTYLLLERLGAQRF